MFKHRNVVPAVIVIVVLAWSLFAQISSTSNVRLTLRERNKTLPLGLWSIGSINDQLRIEKNTAANGGFGTTASVFSASGTTVTIAAPSGAWSFQFPVTNGTANYALTTNGSGVTNYVTGPSIAGITTTDNVQFSTLGLGVASQAATAGSLAMLGRIGRYNNALPSSGQVFIGNPNTGTWDAATLTAGTNITITNTPGSISIAAAGGAGGTLVREIPNVSQTVLSNTGSPVTASIGTSGVTTQLPNGADSSVVTWFHVPVDASGSNDLVMVLDAAANAAPGTTNNKFAVKVACTKNGTGTAYTATDTFTLPNSTNRTTFVGTNAKCTAAAAGDVLSVVIYRDTTVANNAAQPVNIFSFGFRFTSTQ